MKVRDVMMKAPVTLPIDATIHEAAVAMDRNSVGAVVVVDADRPVGVVTDRDIVVRALARRTPLDARVDSVMSTGVVCVDANVEVNAVTEILSAHPFRRVPVVDANRVVGVVTLDDLIVRLVHDLNEATKGVVAQLWFGHPEPQPPVMAG
jgi:CBS domain-containing protein